MTQQLHLEEEQNEWTCKMLGHEWRVLRREDVCIRCHKTQVETDIPF